MLDRCPRCGQEHALDALETAFRLPDLAARMGAVARFLRVRAGDGFCVVDQARYFVRGVLPIPVHGRDRACRWGVWAEIDAATHHWLSSTWRTPRRVEQSPCYGALANAIPQLYAPTTLALPVEICILPPDAAPEFYVRDPTHPIALEQRDGVPVARALACSHAVLRQFA